MRRRLKIFKAYKKSFIGAGVVVLILLGYFLFARGSGKKELFTVRPADVTQSAILSGKVQTSDRADLGFASAGRISRIFVKNNQMVKEGAALSQLEIGDLLADLKIKEANLRASTVDLDAAKEELDRVIAQEDTKVENAHRELLSDGLALVPDSVNYTAEAPTISGLYDGVEGRYEISIDKKNVTDVDFRVLTYNLERTKQIINKVGPTKLGTHGLYISFPTTDIAPYINTTWYLDIPNKSSSSYPSNYNAYNEAQKNRALAVQAAEFKYKKLLTEGDNGNLTIAQAEVERAKAEIRKNTIYAPFAGKVTNIEKEVGENASVGERIISILGENKLEVVLQVSELDVSKLVPGSEVSLKFDALPDENFTGTLKSINSRDTEIEGVPVYEAFVEVASDLRIKTGMSATGTILIAEKQGVLAIPNYFIEKKGEKNFVTVISSKSKKEQREITLGLLGTDSMVEVTAGLAEGEQIESPVKK